MEKSVDFGPLTYALSKIHALVVVSANVHSHLYEIPHLCWRATPTGMEQFQSLPQLLAQFSGKTDWYLIGDLPRVCLFPQPKQFVELKDVQMQQFLDDVSEDIPKLATFIEHELGLEWARNLGFTTEASSIDLPLITDWFEPDVMANVSLIRDPSQFLQHRGPTSDFDTSLHCGINTRDYALLKSEADRDRAIQGSSLATFFSGVLAQHSAVLQPSKVEEFERRLKTRATDDEETGKAVHKLLTICKPARSYNLGIVVQFN